jgi:formate hydrogenlyase subunit 3/multisubunit Na+/H+ antiporter MnhD subunit
MFETARQRFRRAGGFASVAGMMHGVSLMAGLPGQGMHLGADPLSLCFLILLIPQVAAAAVADSARSPSFWACVAGMALTVLAADAFTLIFGFELMSAASWLLVLRGDRRSGTLYAGIATLAAACLIPAVFLPAGPLAFVLILIGAGAKAGLAPLHAWLPRAHPAPPAGTSAIMSGGMVMVALYILIRYGFVVMGAAAAPWWGSVLIALGAAGVLLGSLRACLEVELKTVLACSTVEHVGLIAVGLGIGLRARAMGEPALGALALQAALLCVLAHGLYKPLLFLGAGAVKRATGTTQLDGLGGLMRGMPRLGGLMLLGAAGMAALPPGPGFAPEFLVLHAVIGAATTGGVLARIGFTALLAALGLGAALAAIAGLRLIGTGFLGRPRSLHAAAASEAPTRTLAAMAGLAVCALAPALAPGLMLAALRPVIVELMPGAAPVGLTYAPLPLAALLALSIGLAWVALRRLAPRGVRAVPAWTGGFGAAPAWLPFGDPLTQPSATGFAAPLRRALGAGRIVPGADPTEALIFAPLARANQRVSRLAERVRRATIRERLAFVFAALVLFLLALGLGQDG